MCADPTPSCRMCSLPEPGITVLHRANYILAGAWSPTAPGVIAINRSRSVSPGPTWNSDRMRRWCVPYTHSAICSDCRTVSWLRDPRFSALRPAKGFRSVRRSGGLRESLRCRDFREVARADGNVHRYIPEPLSPVMVVKPKSCNAFLAGILVK